MPLLHSSSPAAFKQNVSTLMEDVGKSPHVQSRQQALAIAYATKRRGAKGRAMGGMMPPVMNMMHGSLPSMGVAPSMMMRPGMGLAFGGMVSPASWMEKAEARSLVNSRPVLSAVQRFGSFRRAQGGIAPFAERQEARGMMHTGPILSAVPGRTDRHDMQVPSGAYVVPAETVSHLGQSNTLAGMKVLNRMFGPMGQYGAPLAHGPRTLGADRGGARGEGVGKPTDVVTAGGEFIIPPAVVMNIGGGDLKRGHQILDKWVMSLRDDHIHTLRKLKPPAKA